MSAPTALEMVQALHEAVHGETWARPESPEQVWNELLKQVREMSRGACWGCLERERRWTVANDWVAT